MKRLYESPELELVELTLTNVICGDSRTEGAGGGGDWGGNGEFGEGSGD